MDFTKVSLTEAIVKKYGIPVDKDGFAYITTDGAFLNPYTNQTVKGLSLDTIMLNGDAALDESGVAKLLKKLPVMDQTGFSGQTTQGFGNVFSEIESEQRIARNNAANAPKDPVAEGKLAKRIYENFLSKGVKDGA